MINWLTVDRISYESLVYRYGIEHYAHIICEPSIEDCRLDVWDIESDGAAVLDSLHCLHVVLPRQNATKIATKVLTDSGFTGKHSRIVLARMLSNENVS